MSEEEGIEFTADNLIKIADAARKRKREESEAEGNRHVEAFLKKHKENIEKAARQGEYRYTINETIPGRPYVYEYMKNLGFVMEVSDWDEHAYLTVKLTK